LCRQQQRDKRQRKATAKVKANIDAQEKVDVIKQVLAEVKEVYLSLDNEGEWLDTQVDGRGAASRLPKPRTKEPYLRFVDTFFDVSGAAWNAVAKLDGQGRCHEAAVVVPAVLSALMDSVEEMAKGMKGKIDPHAITAVRHEGNKVRHLNVLLVHLRCHLSAPTEEFQVGEDVMPCIDRCGKLLQNRSCVVNRALQSAKKRMAYAKQWEDPSLQALFVEGKEPDARTTAHAADEMLRRRRAVEQHIADLSKTFQEWQYNDHEYDPPADYLVGLKLGWVLAHWAPPQRSGIWALLTIGKGGANPCFRAGQDLLLRSDAHNSFMVWKPDEALFVVVMVRSKTGSAFFSMPSHLSPLIKAYLTARIKCKHPDASYHDSAQRISDLFEDHPPFLMAKSAIAYSTSNLYQHYKRLHTETGLFPPIQNQRHMMANELVHTVERMGAEEGAALARSYAMAMQTSTKQLTGTYCSRSQRMQALQRRGRQWDQYTKWEMGSQHVVVSSSSSTGSSQWEIVRIISKCEVPYTSEDESRTCGIVVVKMDQHERLAFRLPHTATARNSYFLPGDLVSAGRLDPSLDLSYDSHKQAWVAQRTPAVWERAVAELWKAKVKGRMPDVTGSRAAACLYLNQTRPGQIVFHKGTNTLLEVRDVIVCDDVAASVTEVVCFPLEYVKGTAAASAAASQGSRWRRNARCSAVTVHSSSLQKTLVDYEIVDNGDAIMVYQSDSNADEDGTFPILLSPVPFSPRSLQPLIVWRQQLLAIMPFTGRLRLHAYLPP
jgi:hypothetical protein